jgi:hypothetical protein
MSDMEWDPNGLLPGDGGVARGARIEQGGYQKMLHDLHVSFSTVRQRATERSCSAAESTRCEPTGSAPSTESQLRSDDGLYLASVHGDRRTRYE